MTSLRLFPLAGLLVIGCFDMRPPVRTNVTATSFRHTVVRPSEETPAPVCVEWAGLVDETATHPTGPYLQTLGACLASKLKSGSFFESFGTAADVAESKLPKLECRILLKRFIVSGGTVLGVWLEAVFEFRRKDNGRRYGAYIVSGYGSSVFPAEDAGFSQAASKLLDEFSYYYRQDRPRFESLKS